VEVKGKNCSEPPDFIKFLGTGGARFVVSQQMRASGGIWLSWEGVQVHIDPGPGALVKCLASSPKLDPSRLDGIILTHRHLDHAADVNIMIEAMTKGGYQKKGTLFAPTDALDTDPVVLQYVRSYLSHIETLHEGGTYTLGPIRFSTPIRHNHPVETYGLKISLGNLSPESRSSSTGIPPAHHHRQDAGASKEDSGASKEDSGASKEDSGASEKVISLISDTLFFEGLARHYYHSDWLIINVVRLHSTPSEHIIYHLCMEDVKKIITEIQPRKVLLTHFGSMVLQAGPVPLAEELSQSTGIQVIACSDGLTLFLEEIFA
jgi:ribonuclease BN (tRNA processing enzyme)